MKYALITLMMFVCTEVFAGIGGSGGGPKPNAPKRVTVEVCDGGESGDMCRRVTYTLHPPSETIEPTCTVPFGEAGEAPCPANTGVPNWLKWLNGVFDSGQ